MLLASTALGQHPTDNCKRWSKKDSKYMLVLRPCIVKCYNDSMGGIDLIDRMLSYHRMSASTKEWTVRTIFHLIDLAIANSWILYREDRKKWGDAPKDILQFHALKLEVADSFFTDNYTNDENSVLPLRLPTKNKPEGYTQSSKSTPTSSRYKLHFPQVAKVQELSKKDNFFCEICNVYL
ncbi:hypothetical protein JTB14_027104 [Gonioctena quinquepunctata]|nr:hypothetical protein JTB14_027104 [Gonioctena quinquepunctata]